MESLGPLQHAVRQRLDSLVRSRSATRLFDKDVSLFPGDAAVQDKVRGRLGWLHSPEDMQARIPEFRAFVDQVRADGFRQVLLLGMGGSSLCPEVLARTFPEQADGLDLRVLDSTAPGSVRAAADQAAQAKTLFLVASKSGGTVEVDSFRRWFQERSSDASAFVAITDPGSPLAALAEAEGYRATFLNPADIGGRYSAHSCFGLVPAALLGMDLDAWLERAVRMARRCQHDHPTDNPGLVLGAALGEAALAERNKLTLLLTPGLRSLGSWVEQLIAESTGKEGKGVLPVDGEPWPSPQQAGPDRLFVAIGLDGDDDADWKQTIRALEGAGQPVLTTVLRDRLALAGEFVRWEVATALCGSILAINPFDEPNVSEAKACTAELLAHHQQHQSLPEPELLGEADGISWVGDAASVSGAAGDAWFRQQLERAQDGDFVSLQAYVPTRPEVLEALDALRDQVARTCRRPVTLGVGPRFLHSTGQYHKGGPNQGIFLQLVHRDAEDVPVPGRPYSFGTLMRAQALGDRAALASHQRRVLHATLDGDPVALLRRLTASLS